jgi:hypothetical protein
LPARSWRESLVVLGAGKSSRTWQLATGNWKLNYSPDFLVTFPACASEGRTGIRRQMVGMGRDSGSHVMSVSTRPNLAAFMRAYTVLEAEYSADPSQIRKSYRRLARDHQTQRSATG